MIVGNPLIFAIESSITRPYERIGQLALGFFVIHVGGRSYGVRSPEATMLACSFDAVSRRLARRGAHKMQFHSMLDAALVVDGIRAAMYDEDRQDEIFFGMTAEVLREALALNEIVWAPDGDEAFDDGGHVLQFDLENEIRLIAFKNSESHENVEKSIAEAWLSADEFYFLIDEWKKLFEAERIGGLECKRDV